MRISVVDAFTDRPFAGNPAGVCRLEHAADPTWMQAVAAATGLSRAAILPAIRIARPSSHACASGLRRST